MGRPVWIEAKGRTRVLKINYRNTVQILGLARTAAEDVVGAPGVAADDEDIVLIPEDGGRQGVEPVVRRCVSSRRRHTPSRSGSWPTQGRVVVGEMALLYPATTSVWPLHADRRDTSNTADPMPLKVRSGFARREAEKKEWLSGGKGQHVSRRAMREVSVPRSRVSRPIPVVLTAPSSWLETLGGRPPVGADSDVQQRLPAKL